MLLFGLWLGKSETSDEHLILLRRTSTQIPECTTTTRQFTEEMVLYDVGEYHLSTLGP